MTPKTTVEDLALRAIGEMFVNHQLTDDEAEQELFTQNIGLTPDYVHRALTALGVGPDSLNDALSMEVGDMLSLSTARPAYQ